MNRWRRGWADYATLSEAVVLALVVEAAVRYVSFSRLLGWFDRVESCRASSHVPAQRLPGFVSAAYRLVPMRATCLRESLVLYAMLRRRGLSPRLRIGVARQTDALLAHAWIECGALTTGQAPTSYYPLVPVATP